MENLVKLTSLMNESSEKINKLSIEIKQYKKRSISNAVVFFIWVCCMGYFTYKIHQNKVEVRESEKIILEHITSYQEFNSDLSLQLDSAIILADSLIKLKINTKKGS